MTETKIYIGLNDSQTLKQEFETEKYVRILKNVCVNYRIPFSFYFSQGGYMHSNGSYTEEATLVISLIDIDSIIIEEIARDLCAFFHQESVLITEGRIRAYYVKESLEDDKQIMDITADTRLSEIMDEYPWLIEEAVKIDERFKMLNNPIGKMFIKNSTITGLSEKAGLTPQVIIDSIREMISQHEE